MILGGAQMGLGEGPEARATLERSLELATQGYLAPMRQRADVILASATGMSGDLDTAEQAFRAALSTSAAIGSPYSAVEAKLSRGMVLASHPAADAGEALAVLDDAVTTFESVGARPALARALRARGTALVRLERSADADESFARAAALASEMDLRDAPWPTSAAGLAALRSAEPPIAFTE